MDTVLVDAYCSMVKRHHCTTDDILCDPERRTEFLSECWRILGEDKKENDLLRRLSNLRKRSKLPRSRDVLAA